MRSLSIRVVLVIAVAAIALSLRATNPTPFRFLLRWPDSRPAE
jgi:hypothetical protein